MHPFPAAEEAPKPTPTPKSRTRFQQKKNRNPNRWNLMPTARNMTPLSIVRGLKIAPRGDNT